MFDFISISRTAIPHDSGQETSEASRNSPGTWNLSESPEQSPGVTPSSQTGSPQLDALILRHADVVFRLARGLSRRCTGALTEEDLRQAGFQRLIKVAQECHHADPGFDFGRWIIKPVRWAMLDLIRAESQHGTNPIKSTSLDRRIRAIADDFQLRYARMPDSQEISNEIYRQDLDKLACALGRAPREDEVRQQIVPISLDRIERALTCRKRTLSIDNNHGEETGSLHDRLFDDSERAQSARASELSILRKRLDEALSTLPFLEEQVLRLLFGLSADGQDAAPMTEENIGQTLGVAKSTISRTKDKALRQLRQIPGILDLE